MKRTHSAFTLVELLVVIAIIGILIGITIPAVGAARAAAQRTECAAHMKSLAAAGVQHANTKGELPGWLQSYGTFTTGSDPSEPDGTATDPVTHPKIGGWAVALMPYLDAQPTYEHWTEDRYPIVDGAGGSRNAVSGGYHELAAPNLAIMQCPSNPSSIDMAGKNSYVSNNGMVQLAATDVSFLASMDRANGAFNNKFAGDNGVSTGQKVRLDDFKDGLGFTILFSENVQARGWHLAGYSTSGNDLATADSAGTVGLTKADKNYAANSRYVHGMVFHYEDPQSGSAITWSNGAPSAVDQRHKINGDGNGASGDKFVQTMNATNASTLARPSSAHVGGVNAGMADGATRFITDSIDYRVYQALMTLRGKSSDAPFNEFVLTDELE